MPKAKPRDKEGVQCTFEQDMTAWYVLEHFPEKVQGWTIEDVRRAVLREWNEPALQRLAQEARLNRRATAGDLKTLLEHAAQPAGATLSA